MLPGLERLQRVAGGKREAGRRYADVFRVFGMPAGRLDYLTFVQLALNEERAGMRNAADMAMAFQLAFGDEPLSAAWAEAFGCDPLEGGEVVDQANADRAHARARQAMANWGR